MSWASSGGSSSGKVIEKLTSTKTIKGHVAKPTKNDPQYLVASDKTGAQAAHKPKALRKIP